MTDYSYRPVTVNHPKVVSAEFEFNWKTWERKLIIYMKKVSHKDARSTNKAVGLALHAAGKKIHKISYRPA